MQTVAEGVETEAQRALPGRARLPAARRASCSAPMPAAGSTRPRAAAARRAAGTRTILSRGDRLRRARPRPGRRPGLAHGGGPDPRLRQRGGGRAHARDRRAAPLEPLARRAVAQGRDLGQHAARPRAAPGLRRRRAARARRARRAGVPHRRAHVLPQRRARAARPARGAAGARAHARRARGRAARRAPTPWSCSTTRSSIGDKVKEEAEEVARAAREESDERVDEEAADVLYHLAVLLHARGRSLGRRRGGAQWPSPLIDRQLPRRAVARRGARARARAQPRRPAPQLHRRPARRRSSAFLKLRGRDPQFPAFLLESAEQGQRVGRYQLHRGAAAQGRALVAGRRRRPLRAGRRGGRRLQPGAVRRRAAVRRRRGRLLRLRPRAHGRAAGRAQPRPGRAAGHGADALRRARGLRPPQAHDHDPRQRLRRRRRAAGRLRRRAGHIRRRAGCSPGRCPPSSPRPSRARPTFASNMPREQFEGDGRADRRVRPRRRRLPGRALPALERRPRRRSVLDLPRPAGGQPEPVHVLPGLHGLPDRGRLARAAADGGRPPRLHAPGGRHAPARGRRRRGRA